MADRLSQYSMIPSNYNNNLIHAQQQQHLQQQQAQANQQAQQQGPSLGQEQQQQGGPQPGGGGMNSMEQQRLWMMQQFGRQNGGGGDMNPVNQAQMAELLLKRNQFVRQQQQQQQQQQQSQQGQQPFGGMGVGMAQMGNGGPVLPGNAQQQSFHDNSGQPSHLPPGFPNMGGMPNGNMNSALAAANAVRNANLMAVTNAERERQMGLLFSAQPQNGPGHMNKFPQQQGQGPGQVPGPGQQQSQQGQQGGGPGSSQQNSMREAQQNQFGSSINQPSPADMFASPAMNQEALRRASPHPSMGHPPPGLGQSPGQNAQPGVGVGGGGPMQPNRQPTSAEIQHRLGLLRVGITQLESALPMFQQRVEASRGTPMEASYVAKLKEGHLDLARKKEHMKSLMMLWQQQRHQAQQGNMAGVPGAAPDQNQPSWMGQPNQGPPFEPSNGQVPGPPMGQPPHPLQSSPHLGQSHSQGNGLVNQGVIPPRSIPTPQQQSQHGGIPSPFTGGLNAPSPFKPNHSQGMPLQPNMPGTNGPSFMSPNMVLDKQKFAAAFKSFCMKRNMKLDSRLLSIENRNVDLHALHVQVMQEGGFGKVEGNDNVWCIIGGKLGFVQFPGTATEPARSGPGVAQQLQHIYKEFMAPFEVWYISTLQEHKKAQIQMATQNLQAQLTAIRSPISMQQATQLAGFSMPELHARGVDEKTIQFIEGNRALLQRLFQEQRSFAAGLRGHQPQNSMQMNDQPGGGMGPRPPGMGGQMPFPGSSGSQPPNPTALAIANANRMFNQQGLQQQPHQGGSHMQGQLPGGMLGQRIASQQSMPGSQMPQPLQMFLQKNNVPMGQAAQLIQELKSKYTGIDPATRNVDVAVEQQMEYKQHLEHLHRQCMEFENKLPMMAVFLKEESEPFLKKMVDLLSMVNQQRSMLSTASVPRYIIGYDQLREMSNEMARVGEAFMNNLRMQNSMAMQKQPQQQQAHPPPHSIVTNLSIPPMMKSDIQQPPQGRPVVPGRPPSSVGGHQPQQPPQMQPHHPQLHPPNMGQALRPPVSLQQPPVKRKTQSQPGGPPVSTPSPAAMTSAATPVASASTPTATASSPSAPTKSPKSKPTPKPKPAVPKRRPSKVVPPNNVPPAAAATPESAQSSAAASTPTNNGKRPREEDTTPNVGGMMGGDLSEVANEGSPPKRAKTEWEAQPTEAMLKKDEEIANIKTEEQAVNFFDQITELIKVAGSGEDGQQVTTGIAKTLDIFLKGYSPGAEAMDLLASGSGSSGEHRELTPPPGPLADAFDEFFDFSFGTVEDEDSKSTVATPDLVSSSSTNPSPESNHDAEARHHMLSSTSSSTMDIKTEDTTDPLRLGTWKEIDGGEAAYYQTTDWKWDSPMPTLEQPWAIFNT